MPLRCGARGHLSRWQPPSRKAHASEPRRREVERAAADDLCGGANLLQHRRDLHALVPRRVRPEPPLRLLELPLAADAVAAPGLVPRDRNVDEPLIEVALLRRRRAPRQLELLVR